MSLREHWTLDPAITFLNHGSWGACPRAVLDAQTAIRAEIEREPVHFYVDLLPARLDAARERVAAFVGADPEDLVFVRNATSGVNAVLRSLSFEPGDELLTTDQAYNACKNALEYVAERCGARVVVVPIPFPLADPAEVVQPLLAAVTPRTRLALLDHVTSPTGLVLPIAELVAALDARGVDSVVDGAHAPGMLDLDVRAIGAAYYAGNFHKWVCAPKGAAMLHVRRDRQAKIHPTVISHGYTVRHERLSYQMEFDWTGSDDPTPWLCVPIAIDTVGSMVPGGWPAVRARCRELALAGRARLTTALGIPAPAPASMIGTLAAVPLPPSAGPPPTSLLYADPLHDALFQRFGVEVPIPPWPRYPARLLRLSAFLYNELADYDRCVDALLALLDEERQAAAASL